jgi:hypothetical protein
MTSGAPVISPAYDIDGDPTTFSAAELRNIITIWRAVAEDFAAWDVDVTTEEADPATGLAVNLVNRGARAVIGGSSYDWYGAGAGGVAYVNTFGNSYYEPAYIFPAQLGTGTPKYVWEAISHGEAGLGAQNVEPLAGRAVQGGLSGWGWDGGERGTGGRSSRALG